MPIHLPALREREGDIRLLLDHFLKFFAKKFAKDIGGYAEKTLERLLDYTYPGNVRELRNIVEYAVSLCPGQEIEIAHLPEYLQNYRAGETPFPQAPTAAQTPAPQDIIERAASETGTCLGL